MLILSHAAHAQEYQWSISPYLGMHKPDLKDLNDKAIKAPTVGVGTFRGEPDSPQADLSFTVPLGFENELDPIGWNSNAGLEFQWKADLFQKQEKYIDQYFILKTAN